MNDEAREAGHRVVRALSGAQLQTFLDERKNGTTNHRTVRSLGDQVAQAYRGRCVIELLQNAHDALAGADDPRRQIAFILTTSPEPCLLVANSGRPFEEKDVKAISELAQSAKDPNHSIGNKGLGFRSVLEVSRRPAIWSTAARSGSPAFAFCFDPDVLEEIAAAVQRLDDGELDIRSPLDPEVPLVDWSEAQLDGYRRREHELDAAAETRAHLSPYQFPRPLDACPVAVQALLDDGYVTVIELPIDTGRPGERAGALESLRGQLESLDAQAMVFLEQVRCLSIDVDGERRVLRREVQSDSTADGPAEHIVTVATTHEAAGETQREERVFRVWGRTIEAADDISDGAGLRDVVAHLPGRWPDLDRVSVGVAVEICDQPAPGAFVIFLPTEAETGTAAWINAPFHGSLDRRQIDFDDRYNTWLLDRIADLVLDVVRSLVDGAVEPWRGRAVIDLVGPVGDAPGPRCMVLERVRRRAPSRIGGAGLAGLALFLCDAGWRTIERVRLMPAIPEKGLVSRAQWRAVAAFDPLAPHLDLRRSAAEALIRRLDGTPAPVDEEWRRTAEALAKSVDEGALDISWNDYFESLVAALPESLRRAPWGGDDPLRDACILPTRAGELISASSEFELFFEPGRGDDAAEAPEDVPTPLRSKLAFLHPSVRTHTDDGRETRVHHFLDGRFVQTFQLDEILERLVLPAVPSLPVPHHAQESVACRELLEWTMTLVDRGKGPTPTHVGRLPVACRGGWYRMQESVFGPGWRGRLGDRLSEVVEGLPEPLRAERSASILLPPDDPRWGFEVLGHADRFARSGVARGLRPKDVQPVTLTLTGTHVQHLRVPAPQGFPVALWSSWQAKEPVTPGYVGPFDYELSGMCYLPELQHLDAIDREGREALSDLILESMAHWPSSWQDVRLEKLQRDGVGQYWQTTMRSPLRFALSRTPWLVDGRGPARRLSERWLVPLALLSSAAGRFDHLDPLSLRLTRDLDKRPKRAQILRGLGLRRYPVDEERIGPELLEALAGGWATKRVPARRFDIFVGQLRDAWRHLDGAKSLPKRFVLRTGERELTVVDRMALDGVYLPDDDVRRRSLMSHGRAIIEMRTSDARGVREMFASTLVRKASELQERVRIDGSDCDEIAALGRPIEQTSLAWLPVLLLTVMAHGGARPTGVGETWSRACERLRTARIHDCSQLEVRLVDGQAIVATSEVDAAWLPEGVLVVRREIGRDYERLASAAQVLLDRRDLLDALKLVLSALPPDRDPGPDDIERALARVNIDQGALADIRDRWDGDASALLERMRPVVTLLGADPSGLEAAANDRAHLRAWFDELEAWPVDGLLDAARRSSDDAAMGRAVYALLGEVAELPRWNAALAHLGGHYQPVQNRDFASQMKAHQERLALPLRALARHVALQTDDAAYFVALESASRAMESDPSWSTLYWRVPVTALLEAVRDAWQVAAIPAAHLGALDEAIETGDLAAALARAAVAVEPDPDEVAAANLTALRKWVDDLGDLYCLWLRKNGRDAGGVQTPAPDESDPRIRLREWTPTQCLEWVIEAYGDPEFTDACVGCAALDDIRAKLEVAPEQLERQRMERLSTARMNERRITLSVAGKDVEADSLDVQTLYAHIERCSPYEGTPRGADDVVAPRSSGAGASHRRVNRSHPRSVRRSPPRHSALNEMAGIVGEIHAWRFLRQRHGRDVVTRRAWVSEIRRRVLPPLDGEAHDISDAHGFDFRFQADGRTVLVEVKASVEDTPRFELGSSQIRTARAWVGREEGEWRILRVLDAFAAQPTFEWLHNPFEPRYARYFELEERSMWVTYRRAKDA